ncbi:MAG: GGDEF domain-containing protein [Pseudomonadota bacterium]
MFTGVAVTLDISVLVGLLAGAGGLGALTLAGSRVMRERIVARRENHRLANSIAEALHTDEFRARIDDTARRAADEADRADGPADTMLRARLDHMRQVQQIWGADARQNALDQVAAIMKRSVRKGNALTGERGDIINEIDGDGFTILVRGAHENEASQIARRLREQLARTPIEGLSEDMRLTASFGVASRRIGETIATWRARAEAALSAAKAGGEDQIVEASVAEEMMLLPAPSPTAEPDRDSKDDAESGAESEADRETDREADPRAA